MNNPAVVETLRVGVRGASPQIALYDVRTMAEEIGGTFVALRALALVLLLMGVLGVLIAAVGLYGMISYTVSQRTREFGIMKALGARHAHIYAMVAREGCRMMVIGIVPGLLLAQLFVLALRGSLPGIQAFDWITFLLVPLALMSLGVVACLLPVRRALRMEAFTALREL
jgi:ABC-type antimicrobial peptide transport system permease subunit